MSFFLPLILAALPIPQSAAHDPLHADRLAADLDFLADDALQGRDSAGWGGHAAARFLATRFEQIGLEAVGVNWLHAFPVKPLTLDLEATYLQLEERRFPAGRAFVPHPSAPEGKVTGTLVWVGFGMGPPEEPLSPDWNVRDAIVLLQRYEPETRPGKRLSSHALLHEKVRLLETLGALAVLVVDPPSKEFPSDNGHAPGAVFWPKISAIERIVAARLNQTKTEEQLLAWNLNPETAADILLLEAQNLAPLGVGIPVAYVSRTVAEQVVAGNRVTISIKHLWQPQSTAFNVVGMLQGSDADLRSETLVLGAHYDHLGQNAQGEIWNGADDNASGVAVLLGLAKYFQEESHRPKRSLIFVAFSGEEKGLLGAHAFLNQRTVVIEDIALMMNFEMVGRLNQASFGLIGSRSGSGLEALLTDLGTPEGWDIAQNHEVFFDRSDQAPFQKIGVPTLHFTGAEHADYHRPSDSKEKVNYAGMEVVARFAALAIRHLGQQTTKPVFVDDLHLRQPFFGEPPHQRGFQPLPFQQHLAY
ncbi:MAG: M28 family peptidase [Planctomycetota bacterium]|nr:M28 family peptidase [Planctomycetota bacterium]